MTGDAVHDADGLLSSLHEQLYGHFLELRQSRSDRGGGAAPLFALEHGLEPEGLDDLVSAERCWLRRYRQLDRHWLPFVVYAAEVGYGYAGDEYWDTFDEEIPGWTLADRRLVTTWFKEFAKTFGGAVPSGRWAEWFKIIAWPITHAILPTLYQRQLARLLYESRGLLRPDLVSDPDLLGVTLASRAGHLSQRFQKFAQNTQLLGLVASALLTGEGEDTLLLPAALDRIVADLSKERESRSWLDQAKGAANRFRLQGISRPRIAGGYSTSPTTFLGETSPAPQFFLRRGPSGWTLRVEVPDLGPLIRRSPECAAALQTARCRIAGYSGAPRAPGWLAFTGQMIELQTWPGEDRPLFSLVGADPRLNDLLAAESRTPAGTLWVFRLRPDGTAVVLATRTVHPGGSYMALAGQGVRWPDRPFITPDTSCIDGAVVARMAIPAEPNPEDLECLHEAGIGVVTEFAVAPVGTGPASWDGESYAEWVLGDEPLLAVTSTHPLESLKVGVDEHLVLPVDLDLCTGMTFLRLRDLPVGAHRLRFLLKPAGRSTPIEGTLAVRVRHPRIRSSAGDPREPLVFAASPANPTLEEMWEGRAFLEVSGPCGEKVAVDMRLTDAQGATVIKRRRRVTLPVDSTHWHTVFQDLRRDHRAQSGYDDARGLAVEVADSDLGTASLRCERAFAPLRWSFRREHTGLALRLHDNVGDPLEVDHFPFESPDAPHKVDIPPDLRFLAEGGGLFVARCHEHETGAVLPRSSALLLEPVRPRLLRRERSVESVARLLEVSHWWSQAWLPGDPFAETARRTVISSIAAELAGLIGGRPWREVERKRRQSARADLSTLESALAKPGAESSFRHRVATLAGTFAEETADKRVAIFADALSLAQGPQRSRRRIASGDESDQPPNPLNDTRHLAEFLLRLASEPGSVQGWLGTETLPMLEAALTWPVLFRAARLLVMVVEQAKPSEGVWPWA